MNRIIISIKALLFILLVTSLTGCLKGDSMNVDPNSKTGTILEMVYINGGGGTTAGSGLSYFGGGALTYPSTDLADTAEFNVNIAGPTTLSKDLTITVGQDLKALKDNYSKDSINYVAMPDSVYRIINKTATIKAGSRVAPFKVIFYPSKINSTQNYMLALTVTDPQGYTISGNFGHIYFHTIGNPIAGGYSWDFTRWNNNTGTGTPTSQSFTGSSTIFAPVSTTTIKVQTGYYTQPHYLISFKDAGNGVLTNFSATFDPDELQSAFIANGVTVVDGPRITVSADYKTFTLQYTVFNGSAYRYLIDKYYR